MAKNLALIIGTEEDKVNCSFYFKVGACRHGDRCSRLHIKPNFSQTLLLWHFYMPPPNSDPNIDPSEIQHDRRHYEDFYEDVLEELMKFGYVEELVVCENLGDHMFGNTYVKFSTEDQAEKALVNLRGRFYAGRTVAAEYSPVLNFSEGRCRQFDEHSCLRGGYCNFLHLKPVPRSARKIFRKRRHDRHRSSSPKRRNDDWPSFPVRGTSSERRRCISKWNKLLDKRRKKEARRRADRGEPPLPTIPVAPRPRGVPGAPSFIPASAVATSLALQFGQALPSQAAAFANGMFTGTQGTVFPGVVQPPTTTPSELPPTVMPSASDPFMNPERLAMLNR